MLKIILSIVLKCLIKVRHWTGRVVAKASTREWPIRFGFFTFLVFYLLGSLIVVLVVWFQDIWGGGEYNF